MEDRRIQALRRRGGEGRVGPGSGPSVEKAERNVSRLSEQGGPKAMYVEPFTDDYLQGDVYRDVPIMTATLDAARSSPQGDSGFAFATNYRRPFVVLVSHGCDSDPTHTDSSDNDDIQVAILFPMATHDRKDMEARGGVGALNSSKSRGYLHQFFYKPSAAIGEEPRRIILFQLHTIKRRLVRKENKVAELTAKARGNLKAKLFLHFARRERGVPKIAKEVVEMILDSRSPPSARIPDGGRAPSARRPRPTESRPRDSLAANQKPSVARSRNAQGAGR